MTYIRQSSNFEEGWAEIRFISPDKHNWERKWLIFDNNENGVLKIAKSHETVGDQTTILIHMESVVSFRTDVR